MTTYLLRCRSGKKYYVNAESSDVAMRNVETVFHEYVSSWTVATNLPNGATVLNF